MTPAFDFAPVAEADFNELVALLIEHFYIAAPFQGQGLGSGVLQRLLTSAAADVECFRVGALRGSDANRFCQRHGFVQVFEEAWDIGYEHPRHAASATPG